MKQPIATKRLPLTKTKSRRARALKKKYDTAEGRKAIDGFTNSIKASCLRYFAPTPGESFSDAHKASNIAIDAFYQELEPEFIVSKIVDYKRAEIEEEETEDGVIHKHFQFLFDTRYLGFEEEVNWKPYQNVCLTKAFHEFNVELNKAELSQTKVIVTPSSNP